MSELVNRIRSLQKEITELQEMVAEERRRYVEEVDHSEGMAFILSNLGSVTSGEFAVSIRYALDEHHRRRLNDETLPGIPTPESDS